jgi:hypothetical protein
MMTTVDNSRENSDSRPCSKHGTMGQTAFLLLGNITSGEQICFLSNHIRTSKLWNIGIY